jgi:glutamine synthetase
MVGKGQAQAKDHVLKLAKEQNVKLIRLWFTDILGFLKSFAITFEELEGALEMGGGFDGSSIQGFARIMSAMWWLYPTPLPSKCSPGDQRNIKLPGCFATFVGLGGSLLKATPETC